MGGSGSGNWPRVSTGPSVEGSLALDVNQLVKAGLMKHGNHLGALKWTRGIGGNNMASLSYEMVDYGTDELALEVAYALTRHREQETVQDTIWFMSTYPNLGGVRWWLACPRCGRRSGKLYLRPGGTRFLCRRCHGLKYSSQRESPMHRAISQTQKIRVRLKGSVSTLDPFPYRPKGMHWATYLRWREKAYSHLNKANMLMAKMLRLGFEKF